MNGIGQILGAAILWTVTVVLAVAATLTPYDDLRMWAILAGLGAHLFTVWVLPYPMLAALITRTIADAISEAVADVMAQNDCTVERVAQKMADELRSEASVTAMRR